MQDGTKCRNPVNISKCRFCDHHVQTESKRINSTRGVLQDSSHAAKLNTQAERAGDRALYLKASIPTAIYK